MILAEARFDDVERKLLPLYDRVVAGDPIAPAQFAEAVMAEYTGRGSLVTALKGIPHLEAAKDELSSLVGLFVAQFLRDPLKYDPERGPLGHYIHQAIHGDVLNEAQKRRRIRERLVPAGDRGVEEAVDRWNPRMTPEEEVTERELDLTVQEREIATAFVASLAPDERVCLKLIGDGVRELGPYAEALGITHLDLEVQRKTVNRIKDRLKKKTARLR